MSPAVLRPERYCVREKLSARRRAGSTDRVPSSRGLHEHLHGLFSSGRPGGDLGAAPGTGSLPLWREQDCRREACSFVLPLLPTSRDRSEAVQYLRTLSEE